MSKLDTYFFITLKNAPNYQKFESASFVSFSLNSIPEHLISFLSFIQLPPTSQEKITMIFNLDYFYFLLK